MTYSTAHKTYIELLESILKNAKSLLKSSSSLLKAYREDRKTGVGHIAQFLLFSSCDECGKFLIVKDLYPEKLSQKVLRKSGFYDHNKKWAKLMRYYAEQTGDIKFLAFFKTSSLNAAKFVRNKIRESALYVDYVNNKTINPGFKSEESFLKLVKVAVSFIKLCDDELNKFQHTPILR